jgi:hypothetical protein
VQLLVVTLNFVFFPTVFFLLSQPPDGWLEVNGRPFPTTSWTVEDGCLKSFPNPDGFQDIRTAETYRSFDLELEWKISKGGNSGIKYMISKVDEWPSRTGKGHHARARGLEYQLSDNSQPEAADGRKACASLYGKYAPAPGAGCAPDKFHTARIVVRGRHVEHWLDGKLVLTFEADSVVDSPIVLQNHASEAWFRNIRIRRLD